MSNLEVFTMDENGAGWVSFDSLTFSDKVEVQLAFDSNPAPQLLCVVCLIPIAGGQGHCYCERHIPANKRKN